MIRPIFPCHSVPLLALVSLVRYGLQLLSVPSSIRETNDGMQEKRNIFRLLVEGSNVPE